ncbi:aminopeptidase N [Francisella philomiragia subsp. philomiragia ATCC 25015]|uniref:aminopeptidase N n=1 Tax=Francisella philomiragia TaxID=28110 RepID=UPI0001AF7A6F|nr:aminopeptidase N [Francisella philomiragia]AJI74772.1 aminopeptidase N [Francisella philomiragia subsp. philomiragia ATCC 25015]EET20594.1 aminopeptidase N [Francisella philomiragia subsp. philomiragia ATCC 25015]MBK2237635.1 aminopeptidase N [Francisella philomiragia]
MNQPEIKYLKNYKPSNYLINETHLKFELNESKTRVTANLYIVANPANRENNTLVLDGNNLKLLSIKIDNKELSNTDFIVNENQLIIDDAPEKFVLETVVEINPEANTSLEGLYKSGEVFCTQCEATGFRNITYYLDRPDVMSAFTVKIIADKKKYPVILSNGDKVESGYISDTQHFAVWKDPFKKPCYLFALVAGDLASIKDTYITKSLRKVSLEIYAFKQDIDKCHYAMQAVKDSMKWDEDRFGLEYDLDTFMIVAVPDFNAGAMENKGLNIFNTKYIMASDKTATDKDFELVQSVVGHEYFHNWTGDRVTCRDWFQLSLKEGLTVFRDQEFTSDLNSRDVKRIDDVRIIRSAQFAEDASPMSHPIRPESYIEMNNFYTVTVYHKGAEIIRMIHTLLGEQGFQKGMKLYFERHDGQAVTCDDFVNAMADANNRDFSLFKRWYAQSGTPSIKVTENYDAENQIYSLTLEQTTPPTADQKEKQALHIPVKMGLITPEGENIEEQVIELKEQKQTYTFENITAKPVASLFRDFSAPVKVEHERAEEELLHIVKYDNNAFNRWDSLQQLATKMILNNADVDAEFLNAFKSILHDKDLDKALISDALMIPTESTIAESMPVIMVDDIVNSRKKVMNQLADKLKDDWLEVYQQCNDNKPYSLSAEQIAKRKLKGVCLSYLMNASDQSQGLELAQQLFDNADNMTDQQTAFSALLKSNDKQVRDNAINEFYNRWKHEDLVVNKWLLSQAQISHESVLDIVKGLVKHPAYNPKNPNKVYSLIGGFGANFSQYHRKDGLGYAFMADTVLALDKINHQVAARMARNLMSWKRYDSDRQAMMKQALEKIKASNPSKNVFEIVSKSLEL